jgi:hypothetical protein
VPRGAGGKAKPSIERASDGHNRTRRPAPPKRGAGAD